MANEKEDKNVGALDSVVRIILGLVCVGLLIVNFGMGKIMPIYVSILVIVLVPFFLKTGLTRACPIMKALGVSTAKKD